VSDPDRLVAGVSYCFRMPSCRQAFGHFQLLLAIVISRACSLCSQSVETEHLYREAPAADERGDSAHAIDLYKRFLKAHPESVEAPAEISAWRSLILENMTKLWRSIAKRSSTRPEIQLSF
jgi:hypothetical protein